MTKKLQIYKCNICGNIVEMLHEGAGELVCCNEPMQLFEEKAEDQGREKHVPVIEKLDNGIKVKVGDVPHPMEEKHHIEWIEVLDGDKAFRIFLHPGMAPEAVFDCLPENVTAREYCNIHGLWRTT